MTDWYIRYDQRLIDRARENRTNPTQAEKLAWDKLFSKKQFHGYRFSRQKMLSHFIVDFYCSVLQLVVEIDWNIHDDRVEYDQERTDKLEALWIKVIRYGNDQILWDINLVYQDLTKQINP